jgi:hypothetical protein
MNVRFGPKADKRERNWIVRFVPKAVIVPAKCLPKKLIRYWLGEDFRVDKCRLQVLRPNTRVSGRNDMTGATQWQAHMTVRQGGTAS